MRKVDYRDIIGGGFLIAVGGGAALHSINTLELGTVLQMGTGMVPAALGCLLALGGLAILVPALFRAGSLPKSDLRATAVVMISILVFALTIDPFGLGPASVLSTVIATRADSRLSAQATAILTTCLALGVVLIFKVGLGLHVKIFSWPW